ncbi:hypothetical protein Taro_018930 [Colocasia esculenta]|uniref:NusG-like N-terminal domain-containing protein n=1 Tax=Colocasia esculenta TaxID=4460 RepID=A0A843USD4_COLES|nr:hypothetical protein [Colocasia esculenta]
MMTQQQCLPLRRPCCCPPHLSPSLAHGSRGYRLSLRSPRVSSSAVAAAPGASTPDIVKGGGGGDVQQLTARERRQLRNERRETLAAAGNWREAVEERLLQRPKKRDKASWKEELNLDNLALLGPQWWVVRVSRVTGQEAAERLARVLARNYPDMDFKVYFPAVKVQRKLKNGSYSTKSNPLFPGCVFLYCVLNKELHDFVRECDGVGGFLGSKVGNTKRQINKPKPVAADEMQEIFHQAKQEQEKYDTLFEEEQAAGSIHAGEHNISSLADTSSKAKVKPGVKPRKRLSKGSEAKERNSLNEVDDEFLVPGSCVRVLSGPFADYVGNLAQLDGKMGKATVGILMFGKEIFVEVEATEVVESTE